MLVRSGVGLLRIVDRDFVDESNLQRQSLFTEKDAKEGLPKAIAACSALQAIDSNAGIEATIADLGSGNIESFANGCDLLIDGSDNFETRFLINDYAVSEKIPWIYGAALGSYGIGLGIFDGPEAPCLRCLIEDLPGIGTVETCETAGILAPVIHVIASFQVSQALRWLVEGTMSSETLQVDVWKGRWRIKDLRGSRNPDCDCCAKRHFRFLLNEAGQRPSRLCGRNSVQILPSSPQEIDFVGLENRLKNTATILRNEFLMRIGVEDYQIALFRDGRSIVQGTDDLAQARSVYAKYIGQ